MVSYLQCTTMGPASGGLQAFTRLRKARNRVGCSGTPWSGQAVNWNCLTSLFSLEPFWWRRAEQVSGHPHTLSPSVDGGAPYFKQREGPDAVGGQLHRVQQRHLDEAVRLRPSGGPVLVAFHLQGTQMLHWRQLVSPF